MLSRCNRVIYVVLQVEKVIAFLNNVGNLFPVSEDKLGHFNVVGDDVDGDFFVLHYCYELFFLPVLRIISSQNFKLLLESSINVKV